MSVDNLCEMQVLRYMDIHRMPAILGDTDINNLSVLSRSVRMTLVLRIYRDIPARLEAPVFIFQNSNANHPIVWHCGNIPGVAYSDNRSA